MSRRSKEAPRFNGFNPLLLVAALTFASCGKAPPPPPEIIPNSNGDGGSTVVFSSDDQSLDFCLKAQPNPDEAVRMSRKNGQLGMTWKGQKQPMLFENGVISLGNHFDVVENPGETPDLVIVGDIWSWSPDCKSNGSTPIPPTIGPTFTPQPTLRPGGGGIQAHGIPLPRIQTTLPRGNLSR